MVTKAGWLALLLYLPDFGQACFEPARCSAAHVHGRTEATKPVLVPDKRTALRRGCVSNVLGSHAITTFLRARPSRRQGLHDLER
jgi:hypothetical protein